MPSATPLTLVLFLWLGPVTLSYLLPLSLTPKPGSTNFLTDLAACSCDFSTNCDPFCCCDATCTAQTVSVWRGGSWCQESAASIEKYCAGVGERGYSSFEDLGCVVYSNRAAIGEYYAVPGSVSVVDPAVPKFASRRVSIVSATQQVIVPSTVTPLLLRVGTSTTPFTPLRPSLDSACRPSYLPLTPSVTPSTCTLALTAASCASANTPLLQATAICIDATCSSTITPTFNDTIGASVWNNGACTNVVNHVVMEVVVGYTSAGYRVVSVVVQVGKLASVVGKVGVGYRVEVRNSALGRSGNPGYIVGKELKFSTGGIYQFYDANKACISNSAVDTTKPLSLLFGLNTSYFCIPSTPCPNALYLDQLAKATSFTPSKYASQSTQSITPIGISSPSTCNHQLLTLNILYSYSGWALDPQYYILAANVQAENLRTKTPGLKQLRVRWVQVAPGEVATQPSNYFYDYFSKLWLPLQTRLSGLVA